MTVRAFEIVYDEGVGDHLAIIPKKYHALIEVTISEQLRHAPGVPTRNRKPLRQPTTLNATWELRFGPGNRFRVFYRIDKEQCVRVVAIGVKVRNNLWIGGKEFRL
jgi:hypothetical protein